MSELPDPAFRLFWRAPGVYKVSKPNIDDTDCYTADQLHEAIAKAVAEERLEIIDLVAMHGGSVEIEAAIRDRK